MKISINASKLKKCLSRVDKLLQSSPQHNKPILSHVLIKANENKEIEFISANSDGNNIYYYDYLDDTSEGVFEPGVVTLNAKHLSSFSSAITYDNSIIEITTENNSSKATIKSGTALLSLIATDGSSYSLSPEPEEKNFIEISNQILNGLISRTYFCIAEKSAYQALNFLSINILLDKIVVVAADSPRLATSQIEFDKLSSSDEIHKNISSKLFNKNKEININLNRQTAEEVLKNLSRNLDGTTKIYLSPNKDNDIKLVYFKGDNWMIVANQHKLTYPDYSSAMPQEILSTVDILRNDLIDAITLCSSIESSHQLINISNVDHDNNIQFSRNNHHGDTVTVIKPCTATKEPINITMKVDQIKDIFQAFPSKFDENKLPITTIKVSTAKANQNDLVCIIESTDVNEDIGIQYIVMPTNK